ncbi:unnamed protein product [Vitrella brassicaformis CCMP3155]|uniref:Helicase ATP-binding domain-containing protein n=2 Tax=Vitrella brassicaformis TaxID=1169539 RepID=A0A0G4EVD3_VITBC|nr:unnamed protein product [Vitrella brassicaformis CCMP3155]|eukprot:CEM02581.1 unnamed protein product [Vitrella brassicaformis CCMP3155]
MERPLEQQAEPAAAASSAEDDSAALIAKREAEEAKREAEEADRRYAMLLQEAVDDELAAELQREEDEQEGEPVRGRARRRGAAGAAAAAGGGSGLGFLSRRGGIYDELRDILPEDADVRELLNADRLVTRGVARGAVHRQTAEEAEEEKHRRRMAKAKLASDKAKRPPTDDEEEEGSGEGEGDDDEWEEDDGVSARPRRRVLSRAETEEEKQAKLMQLLTAADRCLGRLDQRIREAHHQSKSYTLSQPETSKSAGTLHPFQLEGLTWLLALYGFSKAKASPSPSASALASDQPDDIRVKGCILADEMGLGKTVQTTCLFIHMLEQSNATAASSTPRPSRQKIGPMLVVAPLSVTSHWMSDLAKWGRKCGLKAFLYHGTKEERQESVTREMLDGVASGRISVVVTTYEMLTGNDFTFFKRVEWDIVCVDEAHRLKNPKSRLHQAVRQLTKQFTLLLTGTPLQNDLGELWALLSLLAPSIFESLEDLEGWFSDVDKLIRTNTVESKTLCDRLHQLLRPFILRRTKSEVLADKVPQIKYRVVQLPAGVVQGGTHSMILRSVHRRLQQAESKAHESTLIRNAVMEMRKCSSHPFLTLCKCEWYPCAPARMNIASSPKVAFLVALLKHILTRKSQQLSNHQTPTRRKRASTAAGVTSGRERKRARADGDKEGQGRHEEDEDESGAAVETTAEEPPQDGDRPEVVLVFSQFLEGLDMLEHTLQSLSVPTLRLDGRQSAADRRDTLAQLEAFSGPLLVFLLSTRAGGVGLNLQKASTVVLYDSDWNPQMDIQALSRTHRIGQDRAVLAVRLIIEDSVEEQILRVQEKKMYLSSTVVEQGKFNFDHYRSSASAADQQDDSQEASGKAPKHRMLQHVQQHILSTLLKTHERHHQQHNHKASRAAPSPTSADTPPDDITPSPRDESSFAFTDDFVRGAIEEEDGAQENGGSEQPTPSPTSSKDIGEPPDGDSRVRRSGRLQRGGGRPSAAPRNYPAGLLPLNEPVPLYTSPADLKQDLDSTTPTTAADGDADGSGEAIKRCDGLTNALLRLADPFRSGDALDGFDALHKEDKEPLGGVWVAADSQEATRGGTGEDMEAVRRSARLGKDDSPKDEDELSRDVKRKPSRSRAAGSGGAAAAAKPKAKSGGGRRGGAKKGRGRQRRQAANDSEEELNEALAQIYGAADESDLMFCELCGEPFINFEALQEHVMSECTMASKQGQGGGSGSGSGEGEGEAAQPADDMDICR